MLKRCVLLVSALVAGCSAIDRATVKSLEGLSPLTADPADFSLRARLPDGLVLREDRSVLTLSATRGAQDITASAALKQVEVTPDGRVYILDPAALAHFKEVQTQVAGWEEADPDAVSGSVGFQVDLCRTTAQADLEGTVAVDLALEQGGAFKPLLRATPVNRLQNAAGLSEFPSCLAENPEQAVKP